MNILKKFLLILTILPNLVFACINDFDTRYLEEHRFPAIDDIIMGKYVMHGKDFYEWRIKDRLEKIKNNPENLNLYDDLAVAYTKTGNRAEAIKILETQLLLHPNRYETLANLGTIYLHNKEYKKGLEILKQALVINPVAHYGREKYQIMLVEYLLFKYPDGKIKMPVANFENNYAHYVIQKQNIELGGEKELIEINNAIRGVLGMLRFGNNDSPILLEALGNLLWRKAELKSANKMSDEEVMQAKMAYTAANWRKQELEKPNTDPMYGESMDYSPAYPVIRDWSSVYMAIIDNKKFRSDVEDYERLIIKENVDVEQKFVSKYFVSNEKQSNNIEELKHDNKTYNAFTKMIKDNSNLGGIVLGLSILVTLLAFSLAIWPRVKNLWSKKS